MIADSRPFLLDVREKRVADVLWQRQPNLTTRFATDTGLPPEASDGTMNGTAASWTVETAINSGVNMPSITPSIGFIDHEVW